MRLLGRVEDDVVAALFLQAQALVFPSLFEGLGIPILEAMEAGLPVVTTRSSCIPEVAGDAVVYADGLSVDSLGDAIAALVTRPDLAARCRARGQERIKLYGWRQAGADFLTCYRCVAGIGVSPADEARFRELTSVCSDRACA